MTDRTLPIGALARHALAILEQDWRAIGALAAIVVGLPALLFADTLFAAIPGEMSLTRFAPTSLAMMAFAFLLVGGLKPVVERRLAEPDAPPEPVSAAIGRALPELIRAIPVAILLGVLTGVGFRLYWIPGIAAAVLWCVSVPEAIDRDLGPGEALDAGARLTRGHRTQLTLLLVGVWVATVLVTSLAAAIFDIVGAASLGRALATIGIAAFWATLSIVVHRALTPAR
jgi:hypothetical protein